MRYPSRSPKSRSLESHLRAAYRRSSIMLYSITLPLLAFSLWGLADSIKRLAFIFLGFSLIIFLHELGHFLVARACSVKCLAFSVGIGPRMFGWRKGMGLSWGKDPYEGKTGAELAPSSEQRLEHAEAATTHSDLPTSASAPPHPRSVGDCDYRISWLPLGGYVRMLGQDDMDPTKVSTDPRAFNMRPIWQRMCIVSAGVIMNIIFAAVTFSIIFCPAIGVDFEPGTIGFVAYHSPADKAGLQMGDRVIAIDHWKPHGFIEFSDIQIGAALSSGKEPIVFTVEHTNPDGSVTTGDKSITPEPPHDGGFFQIGVGQMPSLTALPSQDAIDKESADMKDDAPDGAATLKQFHPNDVITAVNGQAVHDYPELYALLQPTNGAPVNLTVKSTDAGQHDITFKPHFEPRMGANPTDISLMGLGTQLELSDVNSGGAGDKAGLKKGDRILRIGDRANPSAEDFSRIIRANPETPVELAVLRDGTPQTITATPKKVYGEGLLNVLVGPTKDLYLVVRDPHSPAAATAPFTSPAAAKLLKVDGKEVKTWLDAVAIVRTKKAGDTVTLTFQGDGDQTRDTTLPVDQPTLTEIHDRAHYVLGFPMQNMKRTQKGRDPWEGVLIGGEHTKKFILQVYMTLAGLFRGTVSATNLHGIVGITKVGYDIQERGHVWLWYVLAMVSVNLAVANFLPLPIVDGGLFLLLIVEKVRGRPLSLKVQSAIQIVGIVLLGGLFLFVTYNDVFMIIGK